MGDEGKGALQSYGSFDVKALDHERDMLAEASEGKFLKLSVGRNVVRFLPPAPGRPAPWRGVMEHYVDIGADSVVNFPCPRKMAKRPCVACAAMRKLQASPNPVDQKRGDRFKPKLRAYANVVVRRPPDAEGDAPVSVQILAMAPSIVEQLVEIRDPDEGLGLDFTDPVKGVDIIIKRKGEGLDTRYTVLPDAKGASPLAPDAATMQELLASMHNLEKFAVVPTDDQIEEMLAGRSKIRREQFGATDGGGDMAGLPRGRTASDIVYGDDKD